MTTSVQCESLLTGQPLKLANAVASLYSLSLSALACPNEAHQIVIVAYVAEMAASGIM